MKIRVAWKIFKMDYGSHVYKSHRRWLARRLVMRRHERWRRKMRAE